MRYSRTIVVTLAAASLAFVGACNKSSGGSGGTSSPSPSPSPSPSLSATEQLSASVKDFSTTPYKYKGTNPSIGAEVNGSADPTAGNVSQQAKVSMAGASATFDLLAVGGQFYAKLSGMPIPGVNTSKWLHIDPSKLKTIHNLLIAEVKDPTGVQAIMSSVVSAEKTGEGQFKGTLDLTKSGINIPGVDPADLTSLADKAKSVPFEATVDKSGRLASYKVSIPATGSSAAADVTVSYSDFGTPVSVQQPPAADTVEAPAAAYTFLNS
jgi:LppX_LprAFG lipoprotein